MLKNKWYQVGYQVRRKWILLKINHKTYCPRWINASCVRWHDLKFGLFLMTWGFIVPSFSMRKYDDVVSLWNKLNFKLVIRSRQSRTKSPIAPSLSHWVSHQLKFVTSIKVHTWLSWDFLHSLSILSQFLSSTSYCCLLDSLHLQTFVYIKLHY